MNWNERARRAYEMRQAGSKWRDISAEFGVSIARAKQIAQRFEYWVVSRGVHKDPFLLAVFYSPQGTMLINQLLRHEYSGDPHVLAQEGAAALRKRRSLGRKTVRAIAQVLEAQGYIENADEWMAGAKNTSMKIGAWPEDDLRRAFVAGAAWREFALTGATIFPSDRDLAEDEAERRYPGGRVNTQEE